MHMHVHTHRERQRKTERENGKLMGERFLAETLCLCGNLVLSTRLAAPAHPRTVEPGTTQALRCDTCTENYYSVKQSQTPSSACYAKSHCRGLLSRPRLGPTSNVNKRDGAQQPMSSLNNAKNIP